MALVWAVAWPTSNAHARSPVPFGGEFLAELNATFFDATGEAVGRVAPEKVVEYREFIRKKQRVFETHLVNSDVIDKDKDAEAAREDAAGTDVSIALEHILDLLDRLARHSGTPRAYDIAAEIVMVEYATRSYTDPIGSVSVPVYIKNIISEWRVANGQRRGGGDAEATNLVDPGTGDFYTADEIDGLIAEGFDLSEIGPPSESLFWRAKRDISKVDVIHEYLNGGDPVHEGMKLRFPEPDGAQFEFKKSHLTQTKPKIDVYYYDEACRSAKKKERRKCRQTMKLKFGMETHSDPIANALLSTLGYNADVSKHLKDVRVYLGKHPIDEVEGDWAGYFDRQRLNLYVPMDSVRKPGEEGHNRDEQGEYIEFYGAGVELKPPNLKRVGFFPFSWGLAQQSREARALFLFNAWIANGDLKDEENNKLVLRKGPDGRYRTYLVLQDIGHSLGLVLPEKVEIFSWDLVEQEWYSRWFGKMNRSIELNYMDLQTTGLEHTATFADAKWMGRLIAQLTREQIVDAVSLGRFPAGISELYVEKLINRRNQIVQAFALEEEFELMPVDRHLTTADGAVVDGHLVQHHFEGSSLDYRAHWDKLLFPIFSFLADGFKQAIQTGIGSIDVINPGSFTIEGKLAFFPKIMAHLSRKIVLNPNPKGAFDQYLVVDRLRFGFRVGFGYVGTVEGTWLYSYELAYPMPTRHEAINAPPAILNFLLPWQVRKGELPEKYVLLRENAFSEGFRLTTEDLTSARSVGIGFDADQNWVYSSRSVIDHREADPVVWIDRPRYMERNARVYLELYVLQIPFVGAGARAGSLAGTLWKIDGDKLDFGAAEDGGPSIYDRILRHAQFEGIERIARESPEQARSEFDGEGVWWTLFFVNGRYRSSDEKISVLDREGVLLREERQIESREYFSWNFIDNGETQQYRVSGLMGGSHGAENASRDPVVVAHFSIDDLNTHSHELNRYFEMLKGLGAGRSDLPEEFDAMDWEVSGGKRGRWTRMLIDGTMHLYPEALTRLLELDQGEYWWQLSQELGISYHDMRRFRRALRSGRSKRQLAVRRSITNPRVARAIRSSKVVLDALENARRAATEAQRVRRIVKALFGTRLKFAGAYDPVVLATLIRTCGVEELLEHEQLSVAVRIHKAFEDEHNLPSRRDLVGRIGAKGAVEQVRYQFFPFSGVDLYNMLNWARDKN